MTTRLYYDDCYTLAFEAQVVERLIIKERPVVTLDNSYFYPESGGQLYDIGILNDVHVIDVQIRESDQAVLHFLDKPLADDIRRVKGEIDGARRRDLRLHHSGQHILSQALIRAARAETISVHMGLDSMTIDVGRSALSLAELTAVEELANEVTQADLPIRVWYPKLDEIAGLGLRKIPEVAGKLRVVSIGNFDVTACGGTHVARTGEIGLIKLVKQEKNKGGTRIEFKCGGRALADYRMKHDVLGKLAADLSVSAADVPDQVTRLRDDLKAVRAELKVFREQAIQAEALELLKTALQSYDGQNGQQTYQLVVKHFTDTERDVDSIRALAQQIITQPNAVVLLGISGERAQIICGRSENLVFNMVPILQASLRVLGTDRGGGRPNFAQGGGVTATVDQVAAALSAGQMAFSP